MNFDNLTAELKEKARNCKTPEEILALAKEEGYELSDKEIEEISGSFPWCSDMAADDCPAWL
ncbi:MAG: Nif11-like leader peptide family natural product precursor [Coriobacteriia bacterium]|nr:Nif11-like leader peptide family natural product precursor [Coriobacteriia bacterium]